MLPFPGEACIALLSKFLLMRPRKSWEPGKAEPALPEAGAGSWMPSAHQSSWVPADSRFDLQPSRHMKANVRF